MTTSCKAIVMVFFLLGVLSNSACGQSENSSLTADQFSLPKKLQEISGLAITQTGKILAIADEEAVVYQIDVAKQKAPKFTQFGDPPIKGDFEGLTVVEGKLFAITKEGDLFSKNFDDSNFEVVKTKLGKRCEIEGLAAHPNRRELWLLCKTPYKKKLKGKITAFRWNLDSRSSAPPWQVDLSNVGINGKLSPSGLAFDVDGSSVWIVAAKQHVLLKLSLDGEMLLMKALPPQLHPQAEGVIVRGESLFIADEGRDKKGRLSRYEIQSLHLGL